MYPFEYTSLPIFRCSYLIFYMLGGFRGGRGGGGFRGGRGGGGFRGGRGGGGGGFRGGIVLFFVCFSYFFCSKMMYIAAFIQSIFIWLYIVKIIVKYFLFSAQDQWYSGIISYI